MYKGNLSYLYLTMGQCIPKAFDVHTHLNSLEAAVPSLKI